MGKKPEPLHTELTVVTFRADEETLASLREIEIAARENERSTRRGARSLAIRRAVNEAAAKLRTSLRRRSQD